ncbi:MAG: ABC transporter ATP-binding protein, partial [Gammaproteobacteria bacterium]|nr:ABC transporter ATP-binding protein [Gammaproteobacteria bacterium]
TGATLYGGRDAASNAENAVSGGQGGGFGGSSAGGLWGILEWWASVRLSQRFINALRTDLFKRLIRSPMTTIDDHRIGDSLYRTLYDTPMVFTNVTETTLSPFFTFIGIGLTFYQLWWTYAEVSFLIIVLIALMIPLTMITTIAPSRWIRRMTQNQRAASAATTNVLEETMNNISAVQSLGAMNKEKERFAKKSAHAFWRTRIAMFPWVGVELIIEIIGWPLGFYLSWHVTNLVIDGALTVGDFGALFGLYMGLRGSFVGLGRLWLNIQDQAAAARRVFVFLDRVIDDEEHQPGKKLPDLRHGVRLENVDYYYPNGHHALKNINLDMEIGNVFALVGPTGCGKTSLAYLLPAFLKPTSGRVTLDGHDAREVDLTSLRDQTAYIFQEHLLLSESIRANLELANPDAGDDEIYDALEKAGCMEFISQLPEGIDTRLGRSGDTLSVGQQQRLCIARGLIRDSKILILDEPTAALDPQTENLLVKSLHEAAEGRLVIVIAHRLSTIKQADQIIFLDEGEIKETGSHDTLMKNETGAYREFVNLQMSTTEPAGDPA